MDFNLSFRGEKIVLAQTELPPGEEKQNLQ